MDWIDLKTAARLTKNTESQLSHWLRKHNIPTQDIRIGRVHKIFVDRKRLVRFYQDCMIDLIRLSLGRRIETTQFYQSLQKKVLRLEAYTHG